jgi:hypothetical protein
MKTWLIAAALIAAAPATLAAQTAAPAAPAIVQTSAPSPEAPAAEAEAPQAVNGMTIAFFRCKDGRAFTAFEAGRESTVQIAAGKRYDLSRTRDGFAADGVTYRRQGGRAVLTGADGGPYEGCVRG